MSIKDKIKGTFSKKNPEVKTKNEVEDQSRSELPKEQPRIGNQEDIPLTPEQEAEVFGNYQRSRVEYAKTQDPKNRGKYYQRELTDEEERMLQRLARKQAQTQQGRMEEEINRETEYAKAGVPKTEWKKGWEKKPGEKKSSEVWREVGIPEYQRRRIAAEQPYIESTYALGTQKVRQDLEAEKELYPWEKEVAKHNLAGQLESAQTGLSQAQFERERLQPKAQSLQLWEAEKAMERMKKEQFARTKKGKALNIAGKAIDRGTSSLAQGIGYGAIGMGMALRSGPSVSTSYLTGVYSPQRQNMWTPAAQAHGQTWIQAGRALTPTGKAPAGRALGATNVPAGMAMLPNLKNLNPAMTMRPMGLGIGQSRLSPLPRRRQPQQQTEPGASRVR
jgi:hypothetical protein